MIRRFFCALVCLLLTGCALAEDLPELVRLHVVAADDSPAAQQLKLEIRNECLRCARVCLSDAPDAEAAYICLQQHSRDFADACTARVRELGWNVEIRAEVGVFPFPDRLYGDVLIPAGDYRALKITIGAGAGHNWWCILYPSLCRINEADAAGETDVRRALEWLQLNLGGEAA